MHKYQCLGKYVPILAALILPFSFAIYLLQIGFHGDAGTKVFASYWASGRQIAIGGNPFAFNPGVWVFTTKSGLLIEDINLNSPIFLPMCELFALLPLRVAAICWSAMTTAAFVASIAWMNRFAQAHWMKAAWAFLFLPVWDSVIIGQNYVLIFLLALAVWFGLRTRRTTAATIALGLLIAFKPSFALALPILFAAGHQRLSIKAFGAAAVFFTLPVLIYGPQLYMDWISALRQDNHWLFTTTVSISSYFRRLGALFLGVVVAAATFLAALAIAWRRKPGAELAAMLGLVVGILASPLAWFHYLLVLLPFLIDRTWSRVTAIGAVAMVVLQPTIVLYAVGRGEILLATLGGAMLFATLLLAAGIFKDVLRSTTSGRIGPTHA